MNENLQNPRRIRGIDIAKRYTIKRKDNHWFVPSSSGKGKYKVDLSTESCTCPDYEIRRKKCKHLFAVEFTFEQDFLASINGQEIAEQAKKKKTYPQVWTAYNQAQQNEKAQLQKLLSELCKGIGEPSQKNGRPRLPLEDMIFSCVYKVFSTFSSRRFTTDLREAKKKGLIENTPHFNSVSRYMDNELLTPYLQMLIEESSLPLTAFEKNFSIDASGLSATGTFTWHHAKHTEPRLIEKKDWLKIHCCVGNLYNEPQKLDR